MDLTLLMTVRETYDYHEVQCLAGQLRRAVALLGADHRLKSLAVDVRSTARWQAFAGKGPRQPQPARLEWASDEAGVYKMRVDDDVACPELDEGTTDVIWDALRPLRSIRDVRLSGVGSEMIAAEITAALQGIEPVGSEERRAKELTTALQITQLVKADDDIVEEEVVLMRAAKRRRVQ